MIQEAILCGHLALKSMQLQSFGSFFLARVHVAGQGTLFCHQRCSNGLQCVTVGSEEGQTVLHDVKGSMHKAMQQDLVHFVTLMVWNQNAVIPAMGTGAFIDFELIVWLPQVVDCQAEDSLHKLVTRMSKSFAVTACQLRKPFSLLLASHWHIWKTNARDFDCSCYPPSLPDRHPR